jgi:chemotaxis protein CheX
MMSTAAVNGISPLDLEKGLEDVLSHISKTMLGCESHVLPWDPNEVVPTGLSAVVGFGGKISGFVALHLSSPDACMLAGNLLGMAFPDVDDIVLDAVGEMSNMLAGGLKRIAISGDDDQIKISIPSIVQGTHYSMRAPKDAERLDVAVTIGSCSFALQLVVAYR